MDERKQPEQEKEPELKGQEEAVEDLSPEEQEGEGVRGGLNPQPLPPGKAF